ncbi:C40 family peptidase [Kineococcus siccus]|uniref:C40 family peptidase n=1 Tax=Kineococcus siccus TaxID=2696567 RepID=UPI0030B84CE6
MRPLTPFTTLSHSVSSTAGGAGRGVAVLAAAGGLVATIALPANAAPEAAPASVPAAVTTAVDSAFGTSVPAVVSAPAAAAVVTTAATFTAVPTPAPVVVVPAVAVEPAVTVKRSVRGAVAKPKVRAVTPDAPVAAPAPEAAVAAVSVVEVQAPAPAPAGMGERILATAAQYAGVPYVYGGSTPAGFDCSGYTSYVMRQLGISLPRTANAQKGAAARIDRSQAVPGDLVFFSNGGGRAYHVGIYAGGNQMWDAPRSGKPVQLRTIWSSAVTFGRVAPVA